MNSKDIWEIYSNAKKQPDQEQTRTAALNAFLATCCKELEKDGQISTMSEMKSVVNLLCTEFMNDIIHITNTAEDDCDPAALESYMVRGRGWQLLHVIHKSGVQGLTVGRDFTNLVVSLLPWCLKFRTEKKDVKSPGEESLPPISECFVHLLKSPKWLRSCQQRDKVIPKINHRKPQHHGQNAKTKHHRTTENRQEQNRCSESEEENVAEVSPPVPKHKRTRNIFRRNPFVDFNGQTIKDDDEGDEEEVGEIALMLSKIEIGTDDMNPPEICRVILDIILDICLQDLNQSSISKFLSPNILPNLIQILTSFYPKSEIRNETVLASQWTKTTNIYFQRRLLRLILTLCGIIAVQQNGVNIIANHKCLPDLLDIAQQIYNLQDIKQAMSGSSSKDKGQTVAFDLELCFLSEITLSLVILLDIVFQSLPLNIVFINNAVQLARDFIDGNGFILLQFVFTHLDLLRNKSYQLFKVSSYDPVKILDSFLSTLKSVKVHYIHSVKCQKSKHQRCEFSKYFNHHHNILGDSQRESMEMSSAEKQSSLKSTTCLVALWCSFLLDTLTKIGNKLFRIEVIKAIHRSAICCCINLDEMAKTLLSCLPKFSAPVQKYSLEILNAVILENFCKEEFVEETFQQKLSRICSFCFDRRGSLGTGTEQAVSKTIDSGFSSHGLMLETIHSDKPPWNVCGMFKQVLFSNDQKLTEIMSKQLLTLVMNGNPHWKKELFFRVYSFAFSAFLGTGRTSSPLSSEEELGLGIDFSKKVKVHCLSALPHLLEVDEVLHEFLQNKGIGRICRLLEDDNLRSPVLKVFEALVILDQDKLSDSDIIFSQDGEGSVLSKNGLVIKAFIGGLASMTSTNKCFGKKNCVVDFVQMFDNCDVQLCCENFAEKMTKNLTLLVDMWETCARICLHSKRFVFHFQNSPSLKIAENALLLIIRQLLCSNQCDLPEGSEDSGLDVDVSKILLPTSCCYLQLLLMKSLLIVCSASYKSLNRKDGQEISMWRRLTEAFMACSNLPPSKVKTVCDILLLSAMPNKTTILDHTKLQSLSDQFLKDDDIDDDEIRQHIQTTSEEDYDSVRYGEGGYFGDTECGSDEAVTSTKSPVNGCSKEIFPAVFRILVELMIGIKNKEGMHDVLGQILQKLLQTMRASHKVTVAICQEGLLEDILVGFWSFLVEDEVCSSVRSCLLSLIQLMSQHRLTSVELKKIFQLFNHSVISQDMLLSAFLSVVENSQPQPHHSVTFPCRRSMDVSPKSSLVQSTLRRRETRTDSTGVQSPFFASVSWIMVTSPDTLENSFDLFSTTSTQDIWEQAAMFIPVQGLPWPPLGIGMTISSWIKLSEGQENVVKITKSSTGNHVYFTSMEAHGSKEYGQQSRSTVEVSECIHLVSIGNTEKMLELWVHTFSGCLVVRLTTEYGESSHIIKDAMSKECLMKGQWHHVVLAYSEEMGPNTGKDLLRGKVHLVIDGWKSQELSLDHQLSIQTKHSSSIPVLCVGHAVIDPDQLSQTVTVSSIMLFEGANHGGDEIFHLYAQGPSCVTIAKCDNVKMETTFGSLLTKDMEKHSKIPVEILVGSKRVELDSLRSSMIASYNPMMPDLACFYRDHSNQEMQAVLASNLGIAQRSQEDILLIQQPITAQFTCQGKVIGHRHHSLEKALEGVGGMEAVLFLVAQVFELKEEESSQNAGEHELLQAKALQILFSMVNFSTFMTKDYMIINGNQLLNRVLTSSKAVIGYRTVKVLLDAATSESMLRFEPDGTLVMRKKSEAMICNVTIIVDLLLCWRIWEECDEDILVMIFHALASLVRHDHPHQGLNLKQFHSVNIINVIFKIYQERIQDSKKSYSPEIAQSVISILQSMLGSPPDLHLVIAVVDFLLLVHPATNSYVQHSRSSFYFNTWWNDKSPRARKDSTYVKPSLHVTSTPHGPKTSKSSDDKSEKKAKRALDLDLTTSGNHDYHGSPRSTSESSIGNNTITMPNRTGHMVEGEVNYLGSSPADSIGSYSRSWSPKHLHAELVETVSDLENSDNLSPASILNQKRQKGFSLELSREHKISTGSSGGDSPNSDKLAKLTMFKRMGSYASSGSLSRELSTDDEEGLYAPCPEIGFDDEDWDLDAEKGLVALCAGLLETMTNVLLTLPDNMISVFLKVIRPDIALVLSHHSSPQIRTAVIKVINAYLLRASKELVEEFMQKQSFHLLAVQLHGYPTHPEQLEDVLSFILSKPFTFVNSSSIEEISEPHEIQQASVVVFLSLIENTYKDIPLCHNTLTIASKLFEENEVLGLLMLEHRVIEVITNLVARINSVTTRRTDLDGIDEYQLIFEDIKNLLCNIITREFRTSGPVHFQMCEEILDILTMLERVEEVVYGKDSKQAVMVKTLQYKLVMCVFSFVETESQEKPSQPKPRGLKRTSSSMSYANQVTMALISSYSQSLPAPLATSASGSTLTDQITDEPMDDYVNTTENETTKPKVSLITRAFSMDTKASGFFSGILGLGKKKRFEMVTFSKSEFIDRLQKWITTAVDIIIFARHEEVKKTVGKKKFNFFEKSEPVAIETTYIRRLFEFLYRSLEQTLAQDRILVRKEKNAILWGAKDVIRVQICRVILYMLSPRCQFDDRTFLLSFMHGESRSREILGKLLSTNSDLGFEMGIHIHDICTTWRDWLNTQQRDYANQLLNTLKSQKVMVFSPNGKLTDAQMGQLNEEKRIMGSKANAIRRKYKERKDPAYDRIKTKNDKLLDELKKQAMDVTQNVTQLQTQERNKMVEHVKKKMGEKLQIKKLWQELVQNLIHERAVWYSERSYPKSWQLDPTEGPGRVRKRLKRCHLGIQPRFLHEEFKYKLDAEAIDPPLIYLFEDDHQVSDSATLLYQLFRNEKIQHTCKCTAVAPNSESKGELLVGENSVFFVADEAITDANYTQVLLGNKDQLSMTWPYDEIREIHKRWYQLRDDALEIFLTNGRTCLLSCEKKEGRDELYTKLMSFELSNLIITENIEEIQRQWQNGHMTNFDYLTHLNKLAGRSFNDLMQYPVFPFILKDYSSDRLNLLNPDSYRNLAKPISVQNESKEKKYKENYEALKLEWERFKGDQSAVRPYHYGSHYSNSGIVLHFLVRLPPFTKMFVSYQDNNFDLPDRTFHNMETCWRLASFQSSTDFKEMIPEFFFLPEFLKNFEGFAFGKRQNNEDVSDVHLPPWCKNNPRLFIIIMRQALESDFVRLYLHHWIDLVFGFKQKGEAAVKAINVFHPATYFGIDVDSVQDKLKRHALQAMVKTYGQTPKQLFRSPHPQGTAVRENTSKVISQLVQQSYSVSVENDFDHGFASYVPCPIDTVEGIKWGSYIGSPSKPPPQVVWQEKYSQVVATLLALPTGDVIGVGMETCCLTMNSKKKVSTLYNTTDVVWAAIVTWKFPDGILRINNKPDQPYLNLILHSPYDTVTYVAASADSPYLFVGCESGSITLYHTVFNQAKASDIQIKREKKVMYGHTRKVTQIVICKQYSIFVSASEDRTCIIWDLNKLSYVRSIQGHKQSVDVVAISTTSGDIASSSRHGLGSCLHLHSINSDLLATYTSQDHVINCLAFSMAPEGQAINVVAGGLDNGVIRIWSTIDLRHLRDLQTENLMLKPVISVTFTCDSQRLYSTLSDGTVALWESPANNKHLLPHKFVAFLG